MRRIYKNSPRPKETKEINVIYSKEGYKNQGQNVCSVLKILYQTLWGMVSVSEHMQHTFLLRRSSLLRSKIYSHTNSLASTFISPSPPPRPLSQTSAGGDKQLVCPMGVEHSHKVERGDKQVVCPRGTNIYIH